QRAGSEIDDTIGRRDLARELAAEQDIAGAVHCERPDDLVALATDLADPPERPVAARERREPDVVLAVAIESLAEVGVMLECAGHEHVAGIVAGYRATQLVARAVDFG